MATAALITALLSVSAYLVIPLSPVPVTLQLFIVVLASLLLSPAWAAAAVGAYLALGAAGIPVFSSAQAGMGVIAGPTGGYLIGFLVGAALGAAIRQGIRTLGGARVVADVIAAAVVVVAVYSIGTIQLAAVAHLSAGEAIAAGALPFLVPDAIKSFVAVAVAQAVRRAVGR